MHFKSEKLQFCPFSRQKKKIPKQVFFVANMHFCISFFVFLMHFHFFGIAF